ncbi:hypothetical protein B0H16DRAFT_1474368 [Mycena metata]|uniref:Ribonuclease H1 N-terminal domain-containing protein n=1 Tax=Mycena metata TaxID=1033252 RepID=A0AAD7HHU6_9AGAR|nr:hypothetical protein B0H16DRAFT_1474368 [Mycena metata]
MGEEELVFSQRKRVLLELCWRAELAVEDRLSEEWRFTPDRGLGFEEVLGRRMVRGDKQPFAVTVTLAITVVASLSATTFNSDSGLILEADHTMTQFETLHAPKASSTNAHRVHCVPPFYPHLPEHHDVYTISATAGQKFYVVKRGRGVGFFTNPDDANLQTDNYTDACQRSFSRWREARAYWNDICEEEHGEHCPAFRLAAGFSMSWAPPPVSALIAPGPLPVGPTPFIHGVNVPAPAPRNLSPPNSTPTTSQSTAYTPSPSTPANTAASGSSRSYLFSPSPPPRRSRVGLAPCAAAPASSSAGSCPASAKSYWAAQGVNRIFVRRGDAVAILRATGGPKSLMVSNDLDELEGWVAPTTAPMDSQRFATRFWAVTGNKTIFSARAAAVTALNDLGDVAGACMVVSEDLDELEAFIAV